MSPDLRLVPLSKIEAQEEPDRKRLEKLKSVVEADGILKNPPIVASGLKSKLMQVDGANRFAVLKELNCSHAIVQYVDYLDPEQVEIKSWVHVSKVRKGEFIKNLKNIRGAKIEKFRVGRGVTLTGHPLASATIIFRDGRGFSVYKDSDIQVRVKLMRKVVDTYAKSIERDYHVSIEGKDALDTFFIKHKDKNVALFYPNFSTSAIYVLMQSGVKLPTGITRHLVQGRVLGLNYPLEMLKKGVKTKEKEKFFEEYMKKIKLRYYEESTFISEYA